MVRCVLREVEQSQLEPADAQRRGPTKFRRASHSVLASVVLGLLTLSYVVSAWSGGLARRVTLISMKITTKGMTHPKESATQSPSVQRQCLGGSGGAPLWAGRRESRGAGGILHLGYLGGSFAAGAVHGDGLGLPPHLLPDGRILRQGSVHRCQDGPPAWLRLLAPVLRRLGYGGTRPGPHSSSLTGPPNPPGPARVAGYGMAG